MISANESIQTQGGYGPPGGGGFPPGGGGGGYGGPPQGGPPGGGGYGGPPQGGGYGGPPQGGPPGGYGAPPPQGFGPPGGGFPPPGGPMMPGAGGDVNTTLPLILSIVQLVLCCNVFFGIPALIFAIQAGSAKKTGDLETARKKVKTAFIIMGVGWALEVIVGVIQAILGAMSN